MTHVEAANRCAMTKVYVIIMPMQLIILSFIDVPSPKKQDQRRNDSDNIQ